jgi:hypothetical protein
MFGSARDDRIWHDDVDVRACPWSKHNPLTTIFIVYSSQVPTREQQDKIHSKCRNPSKTRIPLKLARTGYDAPFTSLVSYQKSGVQYPLSVS